MTEILLAIVDDHTGNLLVDTTDDTLSQAMQADLAESVGAGDEFGCAKPREILRFPFSGDMGDRAYGVMVNGYWHDSLVEGPGRRSVVRLQGCPIRCHGCWVPETWNPLVGEGVQFVAVDVIARALLDPSHVRDGVTILGGEPFAQPAGLASLVAEFRGLQPTLSITVYSGYKIQKLIGQNNPDVNYVLSAIDVLIDGPYVRALADGAGPWTGSSNQRVFYLR